MILLLKVATVTRTSGYLTRYHSKKMDLITGWLVPNATRMVYYEISWPLLILDSLYPFLRWRHISGRFHHPKYRGDYKDEG